MAAGIKRNRGYKSVSYGGGRLKEVRGEGTIYGRREDMRVAENSSAGRLVL